MTDPVSLEDLIGRLESEDTVGLAKKSELKNQLKRQPVQLIGKKARQSLDRRTNYEHTKKEISKWDGVVRKNRGKLDLTEELPEQQTLEHIRKDEYKSAMQSEIAEILAEGNQDTMIPTTDDVNLRAKARSDLFNMQQRSKKTAKIKSKLYHKIKNRQKTGEENPEDAELLRAQERMSLKHNKSKFKKLIKRYGAQDFKNAALAENDELKARIKNVSRVNSIGEKVYDSDSSIDADYLLDELGKQSEAGFSKGVMALKFMQRGNEKDAKALKSEVEDIKEKLADQSGSESSYESGNDSGEDVTDPHMKFTATSPAKRVGIQVGAIEPAMEKRRKFQLNTAQEDLIEQAFPETEADEVAAEEWAAEQEEAADESATKRGWGSWAGMDIAAKPRAKAPPKFKTEKVIMGPSNDRKAAKYQVKKLPYGYKSAKEFDFAHRVPVGKDWNTMQMHNQMIAPEIQTTPGAIINPISKKSKH